MENQADNYKFEKLEGDFYLSSTEIDTSTLKINFTNNSELVLEIATDGTAKFPMGHVKGAMKMHKLDDGMYRPIYRMTRS